MNVGAFKLISVCWLCSSVPSRCSVHASVDSSQGDHSVRLANQVSVCAGASANTHHDCGGVDRGGRDEWMERPCLCCECRDIETHTKECFPPPLRAFAFEPCSCVFELLPFGCQQRSTAYMPATTQNIISLASLAPKLIEDIGHITCILLL